MVFKRWYDIIGHDIQVNPKDGRPIKLTNSNINDIKQDYIDNPLSPVTSFILNSWSHIWDSDKNLIVNFPSNHFNVIPLLAYLSSKITSKSTLVFSSGRINLKNDLIGNYNRNYHLLSWAGSDYLFKDIPICRINKNSLDAQIYMPNASRGYKQENLESIRENLISSNKPKILLNDSLSLTKVHNTVKSVFLDDEEINSALDLDIGAILFENADRYLSSEAKAKNFVEWLGDSINDDVKLLFHFSNDNLKFIPYFKESMNALLIPFTGKILRDNVALHNPSMDYFNHKSYTELKVLNDYNCDDKKTYEFDFDIRIVEPLLDKGNLDSYLFYSNNLLNQIDFEIVNNESFFYRTINLLYSINNISVNPDFLTFKININNNWRHVTIPQFLRLFNKKLNYENSENRYLLKKLLSNLYGYYLELSQCKRYGVNGSYSRIAKDYRILEIINNREEYFEHDNKLIVGTYFNTEVNVLNRFLQSDETVEVIYLPNLFKTYRDYSEYNLLLSGVVPPNYFSILRMPFAQVLILSYEGYNNVLLKDQIDLVLNPPIHDEKIAMDSFRELYNFIGEDTNNLFFKDFEDRYNESIGIHKDGNSISENDSEETDDANKEISIKDIFNLKNSYAKYVEGRKRVDYQLLDSTIRKQPNSENNESSAFETITIDVINLSDGLEYSKELLKNKKYLRFEDYNQLDKALEVKPELLNKNDYIVILENNNSFLDLYLDLFDEDEYIDRDFTDYWKELLSRYIEDNELSLKNFYEIYKNYCTSNSENAMSYQTVRNWVRGYVIAPNNPNELKRLGIILNDEYLKDNYHAMHNEAKKLRGLNIRMGRKLSSLIKEVILNSTDINYSSLSYEERIIYNKIKNSIYQVL